MKSSELLSDGTAILRIVNTLSRIVIRTEGAHRPLMTRPHYYRDVASPFGHTSLGRHPPDGLSVHVQSAFCQIILCRVLIWVWPDMDELASVQ